MGKNTIGGIEGDNSNMNLLGRFEMSNNLGIDSFGINTYFKRNNADSNSFFFGTGNNSNSMLGFGRVKQS
jgi:hypothetical protein